VWQDGTQANVLHVPSVVNQFDVGTQFPLLSLKRVPLKSAINEILWIWQKRSNNVKHLKSNIWDSWSDASGSIGKAYGYQLGVIHNFPEGKMNQVDWILYQLKHNPYSRRMVVNMFNHADLREMGLAPCAHSFTLTVVNGTVHAILNQRSQDVMVAFGWNIAQYAALLTMFGHTSNLHVGTLTHVIADAHIYDRHIEAAEQILQMEEQPAPTVVFTPNSSDFYSYHEKDFMCYNYKANDIKLEVAI
jgi:thymidylate synthase